MKIQLIYDPVKPETTVCIDGQTVDKSDIYGFLYPVRHCLLQTWLLPSGSWSGLAWQLQELSRGEEMELLFTGRAEDFEDVQSALEGVAGLSLTFQQTDPLAEYDVLFSQMDGQIAHLLDENPQETGKKTLTDFFPETAEAVRQIRSIPSADWLHTIRTEADFTRADQEELCCCLVTGEYLDSYEKLDQLNSLTRSMRRSQDMTCSCLEDPEKRADFAHYAAQYENQRIRFDTAEACVPVLEQKYGVAYNLRSRFHQYARILEILEQCYSQREALEKKRTALAREKNRTIEQTRVLERSKLTLNWFDRKEPYLTALRKLTVRSLWQQEPGKE